VDELSEKQPSVTPERAEAGDFCPNDTCPDAGKTDEGNIVKYGTTSRGLQCHRRKTCGKTLLENTVTIFYELAHSHREDHRDLGTCR
jgi:hypothetical protein